MRTPGGGIVPGRGNSKSQGPGTDTFQGVREGELGGEGDRAVRVWGHIT